MVTNPLDAYRDVRPDPANLPVPQLGWREKVDLNRQTGFNRSFLESHDSCGCFRCGQRFPTSLVADWMEEPGEEDTGICPYCGQDTLVVGTDALPLSTALLTGLYGMWFEKELKERREDRRFRELSYSGEEDYLRKGIPFRLVPVEEGYWERIDQQRILEARRHAAGERGAMANAIAHGEVLEFDIWSIGDPGKGRWDCEGSVTPGAHCGFDVKGIWNLRAYVDEESDEEHFELLRDGIKVRFGGADDFLDRLDGVSKLAAVLRRAQPAQRSLDPAVPIVPQVGVEALRELPLPDALPVPPVEELVLQAAEEALAGRVVRAAALRRHAADEAVPLADRDPAGPSAVRPSDALLNVKRYIAREVYYVIKEQNRSINSADI